MNLPTTAQQRKLVRLLATYILKDHAHIKVQEKAYNAWMSYFEALEARFPHIAFRSEVMTESLVAAAKREAGKKLFRGPGATC
jgi:hypothetical protein